MNKYIILTKILLKSGIGDTKKKDKNSWKRNILPAILIITMIPFMVMLGQFAMYMYATFATINAEGYLIGVSLNMVCVVNLVFGILSCINVFYFSKDLSNLLSLPLSAWQIIAAKFTTVLVYNYFTQAVMLTPFMIGFGIAGGLGIMYWIYSLIVFFILPIVPLIYAAVIVMILMGFTKFMKNKERFAIYSGAGALVFVMVMNGIAKNFDKTMEDPEAILEMLNAGGNELTNMLFILFPSGRFATNTIINCNNMSGVLACLIFIGISMAFAVAFVLLSEKLYFRGLIGITETTTKRKELTANQMEKSVKKSFPIWTYTMKELKLLFRTPIYFMNCIVMNFIFPFLMLLPLLIQEGSAEGLDMVNTMVANPDFAGIILILGMSAVGFICSTNGITASTISREGSNLFFMKYIPMTYKDQLKAKILSSILMGVVAMATTLIVVLALIKIPIYLIIAIIEVAMLMILFIALLGLIIDLNRPKLNWDSEQKAVKQNLNIMFEMIIVILILAIMIFGAIYFRLPILGTFLFINAILGLICFVLYRTIMSEGIRCLGKL